MTERKFTPPTEFPAEYVTGDGRKAVIVAETPKGSLLGYVFTNGLEWPSFWDKRGIFGLSTYDKTSHLHDLPKKQVHWSNDYGDEYGAKHLGIWRDSREDADRAARTGDSLNRIAVIRREWVEGQPPQYFVEEV